MSITNQINRLYTGDNEIRTLQTLPDKRSFTLCVPKAFVRLLGIHKGDFLKCHVENNKLVVEDQFIARSFRNKMNSLQLAKPTAMIIEETEYINLLQSMVNHGNSNDYTSFKMCLTMEPVLRKKTKQRSRGEIKHK
jgi:antitoxin component of MazEF toxin-antitoxin module